MRLHSIARASALDTPILGKVTTVELSSMKEREIDFCSGIVHRRR